MDFSFNEFVDFLFKFAIIYFITSIGLGIVNRYLAIKLMMAKQLHTRLNEIVHRVVCEKHDGIYYWYDLDNNEFLVQGKNHNEIASKLKQHFADHIFVIQDQDMMLVGPSFDPVKIDLKNIPRIKL
jgi:hypothetical protein